VGDVEKLPQDQGKKGGRVGPIFIEVEGPLCFRPSRNGGAIEEGPRTKE